ncbi:MAG TPA: phosphoribosyltransferase family protein [Defluviitoga sp.]|nr:phosphoribosyltransferase family protein [Defluviitoga sp.]HOP24204.1 phosphoribosyltransferase family protein [Defluviitoga sp.]HPZ28204.1 phosphoribosyltransferase family protein [Defluviitoga sp.]HQD62094.1 phosphoribosyltransferase family protein [Defluviitoga sp.]
MLFGEFVCDKCREKLYAPSLTEGAFKIYHYGKYEEPLSKLITEFKYNSHPKIAKMFGEMLASFFLELNFPDFQYYVSYAPSNYLSRFEKGFIPAKLIAQHFSNLLGFPLINLFNSKALKKQAQLTYEQRRYNVQNKIKLIQSPPENVIIIDDVYTTGATMEEIAGLLENKCEVIVGLTVAKTIHNITLY